MNNAIRISAIKNILRGATPLCAADLTYDLSDIVVESVTFNNHGVVMCYGPGRKFYIEDVVFSDNPYDSPKIELTEKQRGMRVLDENQLQSIYRYLDILTNNTDENELTLGTIQAAVGRAVQSTLSRTVTMGITDDNDLMTRSNSDIAKLVLQKIGEELREYFE